MAKMKVEVDQSELNEAIAKAERLMAMLDDIENRFAAIDSDSRSPSLEGVWRAVKIMATFKG